MSTVSTGAADHSEETEVVERPLGLLKTVARTPEGRLGLALGILMVLIIAIGPLLAPYNADALATGPPLSAHWLGTDELGRDVFSRFLAGGRTVWLVPFAGVTLSYVIGGGFGLFAA